MAAHSETHEPSGSRLPDECLDADASSCSAASVVGAMSGDPEENLHPEQ